MAQRRGVSGHCARAGLCAGPAWVPPVRLSFALCSLKTCGNFGAVAHAEGVAGQGVTCVPKRAVFRRAAWADHRTTVGSQSGGLLFCDAKAHGGIEGGLRWAARHMWICPPDSQVSEGHGAGREHPEASMTPSRHDLPHAPPGGGRSDRGIAIHPPTTALATERSAKAESDERPFVNRRSPSHRRSLSGKGVAQRLTCATPEQVG